jgi:hypothetical protein
VGVPAAVTDACFLAVGGAFGGSAEE